MNSQRFQAITGRYPSLRVAVLGDFCLDRYLEIDPARAETSIETGLPVHNVVNVRPQAGGAGTIVNNLSALGVGTILPIGLAGLDGEGFELWNALEKLTGVKLDYFIRTPQRRTFTYCKPLIVTPGKAPVELNRLDSKNWTATPTEVEEKVKDNLMKAASSADALIVLDQVDVADTGAVTKRMLKTLAALIRQGRDLPILADSRRGLQGYPPVIFKMNANELASLTGSPHNVDLEEIGKTAAELARRNSRVVFVSLAERGILGASPEGEIQRLPALPIRGEIDVVGAGDAVSANLVCALAAGAGLREALELANAAASVVIHKLGTTGTASVTELSELVCA